MYPVRPIPKRPEPPTGFTSKCPERGQKWEPKIADNQSGRFYVPKKQLLKLHGQGHIQKKTQDLALRALDVIDYVETMKKYQPGAILGEGTYATVRRSITHPHIAIKEQTIRDKELNDRDFYKTRAEIEQDLHRKICQFGTPHVPLVKEAKSIKGSKYAQYMEDAGPTIFKDRGRLNLQELEPVFKRYFEVLLHLAQLGIGHFDLKPENASKKFIFDFGLAECIQRMEMGQLKVSRFYRSPEIVLDLPFDESADLWSMGCILFEMYTGKSLFPVEDDDEKETPTCQADINLFAAYKARLNLKEWPMDLVNQSIMKGQLFTAFPNGQLFLRESMPKMVLPHFVEVLKKSRKPGDSDERLNALTDLISKLLQFDPKNRITAAQALAHPFFTSENSTDVAFRIKVSTPKVEKGVRILDANGKILETIDLSLPHRNSCFHIPKSEKPYIFEFFNLNDPSKSDAPVYVRISNGEILSIDPKDNYVSSSVDPDDSLEGAEITIYPPDEKKE